MNTDNQRNWPSATANGIPLTDPVSVSFNGDVVLLARASGKVTTKLYYNVRHNNVSATDQNSEYSGWYELDLETVPGNEPDSAPKAVGLRELGAGLVTVPSAAHKAQPADLSFMALSDERYIYLFRPSSNGTVYLDRFVLLQAAAPNDKQQPGQSNAAANATRYEMQRIWELRYRGSGKKDTPADDRDIVGYSDMLGNPFIEPTLELGLLPKTANGRLAVALLPTAEVGKRRWYFFSIASANQIQVMSWPQSDDGLFDFLPPDPKVAAQNPPACFVINLVYQGGQSLNCTAGVALRVYAEQDEEKDGTKLRRAMRLMATVPVSASSLGLTNALAVYDFNILPSGYLPAAPASVQVPLLDGTLVSGKFTPPNPLPTSFPLPQQVVHLADNSTIYAYLLGNVQAAATPFLLDGGDGLLHCYYASATDTANDQTHPFFVAQYNPEVQRPTASLKWTAGSQDGMLDLVAQRPGTTLNQLAVTVADAANNPDLCDLTVDYGAAASGINPEQWNGLPRDLNGLLAILNGNASGELLAQAVQAGSVRYFDYSGTRTQARLPLTGTDQRLTLVSTRLDLALAAVQVTAGGSAEQANLAITLKQGSLAVTQTWANVPSAANSLSAVLRGDAANYAYTPAANDPVVFGLGTSSGAATLLLFGAPSVTGSNTKVTVTADSSPDKINVRIVSGTDDNTFNGLPSNSTDLAKALLALPKVTQFFPIISAGDNSGPIAVQVANQPLHLRTLSLLFGTLPPDSQAALQVGTIPASVLQGHSQPPLTGNQIPTRLIALWAMATSLPNNGLAAVIANQTAQATPANGNGAWVTAEPLNALALPGQTAMLVPTNLPNFDELAPSKTFTMETWLRPNLLATGSSKARVISFNGTQTGKTPTWEVAPDFFLSVFAQPALQFGLLSGSNPSNGFVQPNALFTPAQAFTYEIWIKAATPIAPSAQNGALLQILDVTNPFICALDLSLDPSLKPVVTFSDGNNPVGLSAATALPSGVWTHLAVTGESVDPQNNQWMVSLYVNGQDTTIKDKTTTIVWDKTGPNGMMFGGFGNAVNNTAAAAMAEVRFWQIRRTRTDIQDSLYFTLAGTEPGLLGYWPLDGKVANGATMENKCVAGGPTLNGTLTTSTQQPLTLSADGTFLALASGIGGAPALQANAFLRSTHWNHVAVSYRAGNAVRLSANQHTIVNCGSDKSFNLQDAFSLEAWIQADQAAQPISQTIAGKWGQDASQQSYWLGLNASGQLNLQAQFQYTDQNNEKQLQLMNAVATVPNLRDGQPHHVAAALRSDAKIVTTNGNTSQFVEVTISFFVDGAAAGTSTTKIANVTTANVQGTTTALTIGASGPGPVNAASHVAPEAHMYFTGMLTGVVLWSRAIDSKDVANSIQQRAAMQRDGAVVAWWFNEQAGVEAVDTVAGLIAKLSSNDLWAVYNRLSEVSFYSNGRQLLSTEPLSDTTMSEGYPTGTVQFTVGGYQNGTTLEDTTAAQFNELRLWQQTRTPRQISDMRFTRLVGDETGLAGYWNFDGQSLADESAFGNNGVMWQQGTAPFVLSGAPVSNEGPQVFNVYGGQVTEFQQRLIGTPSAIEFSEITREPASALAKPPQDGEAPKLQGSLERAYFYTTGTVNPTPGFYAGALRLVYLGQVQTDATLIGYIEGAPPVPSENLTRPYYGSATGYFSYFNASSISFTDVETTTLTFNSSYNYSSTLDHTTSGGFAYASDVKTTTPVIPLAPEVITTNTKIDFKIGAKEKGSFATQNQQVQNSTSSWALALTDSLSLRGNWEKDDAILNPQVGRRFLPDNVGYALVSSLTADVYLTYNAATGAAVGRSVVPNPDIPPDSNIITFQIDPTYVKNGTLDGKVGLYDDPTFGPGGIPGSYFKPIESYRLKQKIAKQTADEMRYFDQFDTYKRALGSTKSLDDQEPYRLVQRTADGAIARQGLANTYVWTAAGGMHTEQEQFTDQFTTTFTGGYSVSNQFGVITDFKGVGGAGGILLGGFFSLDWMAGFKIDITSTKTKTVVDAFGLNVAVTGEPALLGWDGKNYSDQPIPGKVAGYRFNTFYLPPDTDNGSFLMHKVVDKIWLNSNAPDAITLRAARVSNPAWRILHRVTYVNRIPPSLDNTPNQTLPAPIARIIDLANNEVLVDLILTALGTNAPTPANIGTALAIVLNPPAQAGQFPPSKLGAVVPWWDDFLATTRGTNRNQANYELLQSLQLDILRYFLAGLSDGSIKQ